MKSSWAACTGSSPTWTSTPDYVSVSSCVSRASRNDTINVTAGTGSVSWGSNELIISKGLTLAGPGRASLTITYSDSAIQVRPDATVLTNNETIRITGFTFDGGGSATRCIEATNGIYGTGNFGSVNSCTGPPCTTTPLRKLIIDNNTFKNSSDSSGSAGCMWIQGQVRGVIYNNIFDDIDLVAQFESFDDVTIDWVGGHFPFSYGSFDNLYFEDNTIQFSSAWDGSDAGGIYAAQGGRVVMRYNTWNMTNASDGSQTMIYDQHGFQSYGDGSDGTMIGEYYGNIVNDSLSFQWINQRGSWLITHDNVATGTGGLTVQIDQYPGGCNSADGMAGYGLNGQVNNTYTWNTKNNGTMQNMDWGSYNNCGLAENTDWFNYNASCSASSCSAGIGIGSSAPTGTCTTGVGYWVASGSLPSTMTALKTYVQAGTFYKCTAPNTWAPYYTPYTYPHPLRVVSTDSTPPSVSLTAPTNGSTVSGSSVTVSANASDNVSVAGVQFKLDGANLGSEDTTSPYSISWNTTTTSNGSHTLTAVARDTLNNQTTSSGITVTVNNASDTQAPTVPTNLSASAVSSSQINLTWTASTDNVGVTGYRIYRGGTQIATSATNSYSDTGLSPSTQYTYTVAAYDGAGNVSNQSTSASATTQAGSGGAGPIAWWKFDETSGTTASDSSGNNNTGTLVNGPVWTTGKIGNALSFDGVSNYVYSGNFSPSLNGCGSGGNDYTVTAWIYPTTNGSDQYIISTHGSWTITFGKTSGNVLGTLGEGSLVGKTALATGRWYHVALVATIGGTGKIYLNGVDDTSTGSPSSHLTCTYGLYIGANDGGTSNNFNGLIDDVRIYNRALSAAEVQALYNAGTGDATPPSPPTGLSVI